MPTDIAYPFGYDSGGDIDTVTERPFYEQHAAQLALLAIDEPLGGPLTANQTTEITSQVERVLGDSPYFQSPRVAVTTVDGQQELIELTVEPLEQSAFAITLTESERTQG